jgi:hypothetical protein
MIDGIPKRPLYFYQRDIIDHMKYEYNYPIVNGNIINLGFNQISWDVSSRNQTWQVEIPMKNQGFHWENHL